MLCSIEFGTTKGYLQSQQHYWVVANSLVRAIAMATRQVVLDYPVESKEEEWEVVEAKIKNVDNPLIDWEKMNIRGDAEHARISVSDVTVKRITPDILPSDKGGLAQKAQN